MGNADVRDILLYVVSEDGAFLNHRLPMARAALKAGFEVHVATRVTKRANELLREGFKVHDIAFRRGGLSPLSAIASIRAIRAIERLVRPHVVHHSSLQSCILGSIAAFGTGIRQINAFTGLGYAFTSKSTRARATQLILKILLKVFSNRSSSIALVQNPDDQAVLRALGFPAHSIVLIPGSGVDTDGLQPLPEPSAPITIGFAGRLLVDKGIRSLVAAHRLLTNKGFEIHLLIAGDRDPANPASISVDELGAWRQSSRITILGHVDDIETLWRNAHIAVLPSHREGLPKSLLEAAAYGRPLIATNAPGCREIAIEGHTGLLVPIDDPLALSRAIEKLARSPDLRARYGAAARQLVVEQMSSQIIGEKIVALYRSML